MKKFTLLLLPLLALTSCGKSYQTLDNEQAAARISTIAAGQEQELSEVDGFTTTIQMNGEEIDQEGKTNVKMTNTFAFSASKEYYYSGVNYTISSNEAKQELKQEQWLWLDGNSYFMAMNQTTTVNGETSSQKLYIEIPKTPLYDFWAILDAEGVDVGFENLTTTEYLGLAASCVTSGEVEGITYTVKSAGEGSLWFEVKATETYTEGGVTETATEHLKFEYENYLLKTLSSTQEEVEKDSTGKVLEKTSTLTSINNKLSCAVKTPNLKGYTDANTLK